MHPADVAAAQFKVKPVVTLELKPMATGGEVSPLLSMGFYWFDQAASGSASALPSGEQRLSAPTLFSPGIEAVYWFLPEVGVQARYQVAFYTFSNPQLEEGAQQGDVKHSLTLEGRYRYQVPVEQVRATVSGRLGVALQDHPAFTKAESGLGFEYDLPLPQLLLGVTGSYYPRQRVETWATVGLGLHLPMLGQVSVQGEAGVRYALSRSLSVGGALELWQRHVTAYNPSGEAQGRLQDVWLQGWGFVSWSF